MTADRTTPEADVTLTSDERESLTDAVFAQGYEPALADVLAEAERIIAKRARLAAQAAPAPAPAEPKEGSRG